MSRPTGRPNGRPHLLRPCLGCGLLPGNGAEIPTFPASLRREKIVDGHRRVAASWSVTLCRRCVLEASRDGRLPRLRQAGVTLFD